MLLFQVFCIDASDSSSFVDAAWYNVRILVLSRGSIQLIA